MFDFCVCVRAFTCGRACGRARACNCKRACVSARGTCILCLLSSKASAAHPVSKAASHGDLTMVTLDSRFFRNCSCGSTAPMPVSLMHYTSTTYLHHTSCHPPHLHQPHHNTTRPSLHTTCTHTISITYPHLHYLYHRTTTPSSLSSLFGNSSTWPHHPISLTWPHHLDHHHMATSQTISMIWPHHLDHVYHMATSPRPCLSHGHTTQISIQLRSNLHTDHSTPEPPPRLSIHKAHITTSYPSIHTHTTSTAAQILTLLHTLPPDSSFL